MFFSFSAIFPCFSPYSRFLPCKFLIFLIKAYGIAAVYPADGKEDDVLEALNGFIDTQKESFQQYLEEEYETASNTRLETLEDGTILMVMHPDQDTVFDTIRDAVESAQS